tara:strand:- start:2796 stop:2957 length:162 start_codon:yes stop_codon:yes gene_type:complete
MTGILGTPTRDLFVMKSKAPSNAINPTVQSCALGALRSGGRITAALVAGADYE